MTVRHIVMWNLRGETPEQKREAAVLVKSLFEGLRDKIPGLLHVEVGIDSSGVDYSCDVVLYSEFSSQAALDAYASHPEHLRIRQRLEGVRIARYQVDYRVAPTEQALCKANGPRGVVKFDEKKGGV